MEGRRSKELNSKMLEAVFKVGSTKQKLEELEYSINRKNLEKNISMKSAAN